MKGVALAILLVASAAGVLAFQSWKRNNRAVAHMETYTQADLANMCQAINLLVLNDPGAFSNPSVTNLNASSLYALLSQTNSGVRVLEPRTDWDKAKQLLDRWGRPIRVDIMYIQVPGTGRKNFVLRCKLWSVGPNGKDEGGGGDDICATVNIEVDP